MLLTASIILTSIAQVLLVLFVFLKGTKNLTNVLFALIGTASWAWALMSYLSIVLIESPHLITIVRLILFCVVLQNGFFYLFAKVFPSASWQYSKRWLWVYTLLTLVTALAVLSPFVFTGVRTGDGPAITQVGPGMIVFIAHAALSITFAFRSLISKYHKAVGATRQQLQILLIASVLVWVVVPITNFAVTPLLKTTFFVQLSPVYTFLFACIIAYAIVRHRLFDIKRVVVRAVAYMLTITTVLVLFIVIFLTGIAQIFGFGTLALDKQLLLFAFAMVAGLIVPPLARFFDGVTQRLFFRKAYDSQKAIDDMTGVFVQADTLKELLENSSRLLVKILGASAVTVSLTHADGAGQRTAYTTLPSQAERPEPVLTEAHMLATDTRLIALDALDETQEALGAELNAMNIGVVSQLRSPVGIVGYLMIGYKQNGTHYGRQDLDFIDIVGDEFAIAIQSELRFEEIKAFNLELQHKIDEATKELQASNKKLQELDQAKDEFISMASHQLRTPLTTVKGYLSMVLEGDVGKVAPNQKKVLEEAYDSAQRMVFLIGDFLNVSRLQTGRFIMEWAPADLGKIVAQEVSQLVPSAASRKLKLVYVPPASFPDMIVDENKLRQVMMNFIDNAIYYSKPNTTIDVSLVKLASEVVFKVVDHGIGVPVSERPKLFTKFYRASNAKKQRPDGTGIGLFMAKKVIVAHGGSVIFETEEGKGSTFGFSLPLKNDPKQLDKQPSEDK